MTESKQMSLRPARTAKTRRQLSRFVLGYLLAAPGLLWVFHGIQAKHLLDRLTNVNWWWVGAAVGCDILSYLCQGLRWQLLLRPMGGLSWLRTTQAVYAGLFASDVLPMRVGELLRGYLVSRRMSAGFVSVLPSIAVERLFDGIWLVVAFSLAAMLVPLPGELLVAGDTLGIVVLLATGFVVYLLFRNREALKDKMAGSTARGRLWQKTTWLIRQLDNALLILGRTRFFYLSFSVSLLILMLQAAAFCLMMLAYGLRLSVWSEAVVFVIVRVGTLVPSAPANVGTYQFFCVVGLTLFGVEKTAATGFSLMVFAVLTVPLWVIGLFALSRSGQTLHAIRNEVGPMLVR